MNRTVLRKIARHILSHKIQTVLVSASIFVGVLSVVAFVSTGEMLVHQLAHRTRAEQLAMIYTTVTLNTDGRVDNAAYLDRLQALPGIEAVQATASYPAYWKKPGAESFEEGRLFAYSAPFEAMSLDPVELFAGHYPTVGQNELAVERRFADRHGVRVGDTLVLRVVSQPSQMREEAWTIAGIIYQPHLYAVSRGEMAVKGDTMLFAAYEDAQIIAGFAGFNRFLARYADYPTAQSERATFEQAISDSTPYVPIVTLTRDPTQSTFVRHIKTLSRILGILSFVALTLSGFLIFNVINAMVLEQRRRIGIMKLLGSAREQLFAMYAGISLVYGILGVIPGVILGIPVSSMMVNRLAYEINILVDDTAFSPTGIAAGIILGLLVPFGAASLPVLAGIRVTIFQAITDRGIDATYRGGRIARLIDRLPLTIGSRQTLRYVMHKKSRLIFTLIALLLAAGAFMGIQATLSASDRVIDQIYNTFGMHILIRPHKTQDVTTVRNLILDQVTEIETVDPGIALTIQVEGYTPSQAGISLPAVNAFGFDPHNPAAIRFDLRSGTAWSHDADRAGVVITTNIADALDKNVGETVTIIIGDQRQTFEIIGVSTYPLATVWFQWQTLARLSGLTGNVPLPNRYTTVVDLDGTAVNAIGIDAQVAPMLMLTDGEFLTPGENEVLITDSLAARHGYALHDTVTLTAGDNTATYSIAGIVTLPQELKRPTDPSDAIALYWTDLAHLEALDLDGDPVPNTFAVTLAANDPTPAQVDAKIHAINAVLLDHEITADYTNWVENTKQVSQLITTLSLVLNSAVALIGAVGAIGILTTLSMSVFERRREIGVMRMIGATSSTIAIQFLSEGVVIGVIAWLLGVPVSFWLHHTIIDALDLNSLAGLDYPLVTLPYGLIGMLVLAIAASLWPSMVAANKPAADALRIL